MVTCSRDELDSAGARSNLSLVLSQSARRIKDAHLTYGLHFWVRVYAGRAASVSRLRIPSYLAWGGDLARPHVPASVPREPGNDVGRRPGAAFYMFYMRSRPVHEGPVERVLESARQWLCWTRIPSVGGTLMTPMREPRSMSYGWARRCVLYVLYACRRV